VNAGMQARTRRAARDASEVFVNRKGVTGCSNYLAPLFLQYFSLKWPLKSAKVELRAYPKTQAAFNVMYANAR